MRLNHVALPRENAGQHFFQMGPFGLLLTHIGTEYCRKTGILILPRENLLTDRL